MKDWMYANLCLFFVCVPVFLALVRKIWELRTGKASAAETGGAQDDKKQRGILVEIIIYAVILLVLEFIMILIAILV